MTVLQKIIQMYEIIGAKETSELLTNYLKDEEEQIKKSFSMGKSRRDFERDRNPPPGLYIPDTEEYFKSLNQ